MAKKEKRFEVVLMETSMSIISTVIRDKKTGVNYLMVNGGAANGLTPLLDRDGKPVITSEDADYGME